LNKSQAIALGQLGLSLDDFLDLTPFEFTEVYKSYIEKEEAKYRVSWMQTQIIALSNMTPQSKELFETVKSIGQGNTPKEKPEESTKERFNELKNKFL